MNEASNYLVVFTCALGVDFAWAKYTAFVAARQRWLAGIWSIVIGAMGFITTINFVADHSCVWAMLAGYFVGTVLAVEPEKS